MNGDQGTPLAETVAPGLFQDDLAIQPCFFISSAKASATCSAAVGQAPGSPAYGDLRMAGLQLRQDDFSQFFQVLRVLIFSMGFSFPIRSIFFDDLGNLVRRDFP